MTIRKAILTAAGSALILAFPVAVQAQADQPAPAAPADPAAPMPSTDPTMAAPAASAPASAAAQAPADTSAAAKDYPTCSATVTDGCMQRSGSSKAHRGKHKKS